MENLQKKLFGGVMILLLLPIMQIFFRLIEIKPLGGYEVLPSYQAITKETWFNNEYQDKAEQYLKANFGFRNWAIRVNHQLAYSLYGMSKVNNVIIGKNGYLYEPIYINARKGTDFLGRDKIVEYAQKAKKLQDTLQALGKHLFFVVAPSKADFYPEYLLDTDSGQAPKELTNYGVFVQEMTKNGVDFLDFNEWFLQMKDTTTAPLFPKTGIHYSAYGATVAAQRIISEIEKRMGKDLPNLLWNTLLWKEKPEGDDNDLELALNLIFRMPNTKLAYPQVYISGSNNYRPKVISIGDSFYWQLFNMGVSANVFNNGQFWYYLQEVHPGGKKIGELNLKQELDNAEVIFFVLTPATMGGNLERFVKTLFQVYYDEITLGPEYDGMIKQKMEEIKNTPEWLAAVEQKAKERNITLSEMIYLDAVYVIMEDIKSKKD